MISIEFIVSQGSNRENEFHQFQIGVVRIC